MIEYKNVYFTYSAGTPFEQTVLEDFSLEIDKGERIAVIGKTGSGKSTVIKLSNATIKPERGFVTVDSLNTVDKKTIFSLRKKVGLVFQYPESQFFCPTVLEEVEFALKNFGFSNRETMIHEALNMVGLPLSFLNRSPFRLSGGEMRLVAIASIICWNPEYLFFDEPTAGLDYRGRKTISQLIDRLHKSGKTVVVVTHNEDFVRENLSRVIAIKGGKKVFDGSTDEYYKLGETV